MKPVALNLLNHPRTAVSAWRSWVFWGLPSLGLVLLCGVWVQAQRSDWERQHQHWRQQLALQAAQQARQRALRERHQAQVQQRLVWQGTQAQQQRVLAVQGALQQEAEQGLRLVRWQSDGQSLLLQGHGVALEALPGLQARLGQALGQRWSLQSLATGPSAEGVGWVLETPWPSASASKVVP